MTPPPFTSLTQVTAAAVRPRHSSCVKETFSMTYRAARRRGGAHRLPLCAPFLAAPLAMSSSTTVEELMSARVRQVWSSAGGRGRRGTITRRRNSCFLQSNPELGSPVVCWRAPPVSCRFFLNLPFCFFIWLTTCASRHGDPTLLTTHPRLRRRPAHRHLLKENNADNLMWTCYLI